VEEEEEEVRIRITVFFKKKQNFKARRWDFQTLIGCSDLADSPSNVVSHDDKRAGEHSSSQKPPPPLQPPPAATLSTI